MRLQVQQPPFDARDALARADRILALAPTRSHIVRPALRGKCVVRFVLPLDELEPRNRLARRPAWAMGEAVAKVAARMRSQFPAGSSLATMVDEGAADRKWILRHLPMPLEGRPQVLCVRFSSVAPDTDSGWEKMAVDALCCMPPPLTREGKLRKKRPLLRLGIIKDDKPALVERITWWEYQARPARGFGLIEVRT